MLAQLVGHPVHPQKKKKPMLPDMFLGWVKYGGALEGPRDVVLND